MQPSDQNKITNLFHTFGYDENLRAVMERGCGALSNEHAEELLRQFQSVQDSLPGVLDKTDALINRIRAEIATEEANKKHGSVVSKQSENKLRIIKIGGPKKTTVRKGTHSKIIIPKTIKTKENKINTFSLEVKRYTAPNFTDISQTIFSNSLKLTSYYFCAIESAFSTISNSYKSFLNERAATVQENTKASLGHPKAKNKILANQSNSDKLLGGNAQMTPMAKSISEMLNSFRAANALQKSNDEPDRKESA